MAYICLSCYRVVGFPKILPQKSERATHIPWMCIPNYELYAGRLHGVAAPVAALAAAGAWWRLAFYAANGPCRRDGYLVTRRGGLICELRDEELARIVGVAPREWGVLRAALMAPGVALLEQRMVRLEVSDEEARRAADQADVPAGAIERQLTLELEPRSDAEAAGTGAALDSGLSRAAADIDAASMPAETNEGTKEGRKDFGSPPRRGELDDASDGGRPAAAPHGGAESVGPDAEAAGRAVLCCLSAAEAGNRRTAHHGWVTALAQYLCSNGPTAADVEQWTVIFANTYDGDAAPRQRVARLSRVLAAAERIHEQWHRHAGGEAAIRNRAAKFASWCQRMGILHRARARPQRS